MPTHKLLFAVALLVVGVALTDVQASTYTECWNACGPAYQDSCGWMRKRLKRKRCLKRLLRQCQVYGVDTMCPAPPPPTTTTTSPYIPPTTTTLPPPPRGANLVGHYQFVGTVIQDTCGLNGVDVNVDVPFTVSSHSNTSLSGTLGTNSLPVTGTYSPTTHSWNLGNRFEEANGCVTIPTLGVGNDTGFASGVGTGYAIEVSCPDGTYCYFEAGGATYWN
jgi:hypothetical protein